MQFNWSNIALHRFAVGMVWHLETHVSFIAFHRFYRNIDRILYMCEFRFKIKNI